MRNTWKIIQFIFQHCIFCILKSNRFEYFVMTLMTSTSLKNIYSCIPLRNNKIAEHTFLIPKLILNHKICCNNLSQYKNSKRFIHSTLKTPCNYKLQLFKYFKSNKEMWNLQNYLYSIDLLHC